MEATYQTRSFEGNGETALPWMKQVKEETGMLTATEVATPEHVELALKYGIDVLWVGAVLLPIHSPCRHWQTAFRAWMFLCW